ncbi:MAG: phosphoadenylyl-sulfate reductase [Dehalococcoidia bacterium]|nr:phosphoadenylyl-sulfate reductase [Dehalococcoidia bacterium]
MVSAIDNELKIAEWQKLLDGKTPQEVLAWAFKQFGDKVIMACSFGGITGMAMLDMAVKINPNVHVFYGDTDYLFPETHELVEIFKKRSGITPIVVKSRWTPEQQAKEFGAELWKTNPDMCCQLRKVEPTGRALEGYDAWITGIRSDQTKNRSEAAHVTEWDSKYELVKINPMMGWTSKMCNEYNKEHNVPVNALHAKSYPSIGCTNCTRPVKEGEDERAGRWSGQDKEECGIHMPDSPEALLAEALAAAKVAK